MFYLELLKKLIGEVLRRRQLFYFIKWNFLVLSLNETLYFQFKSMFFILFNEPIRTMFCYMYIDETIESERLLTAL